MAVVGSERCPHCDGTIVPEIAVPFGEATCASCGQPVWFLTVEGSLVFFRYCDAAFVRELFEAIPEQQRFAERLGLDSLDVVELLVDFEEALARAEV